METDIKRRKRRKARGVLLTVIAILCVVLAVLSAVVAVNLTPALRAIATARIKALASRAMNDAIIESMQPDTEYAAIISVLSDGQRAYMLQADTRAMNVLAADCALSAQERITAIGEQGIAVAIGTVTGISFLAGKGPVIRVQFSPAGSVLGSYSSEFVSSGINQTLYRVKLCMNASVKLVMPGVSETVNVTAEAVIAESVIVGDVPQVYTNVEDEEDMLNLLPTEVP